MARFNFCGATYQSASPSLDAQFTMNLYPVPDESTDGRSRMALYPTPGLSKIATLPGCSAVVGLFEFLGSLYTVGQITNNTMNIWQVGATGALTANISPALIETGTGPVSILGMPSTTNAGRPLIGVITGGSYYLFTLNPINIYAFINNLTFLSGEWVDNFVVTLCSGNQFQLFGPGTPGAFNALNTSIVSEFPDNLVGMIANDRLLYFFGDKRCVPYYNSGALFPFVPVPGVFIEQGLAGQNAKCRADNTIFWLDNDERGGRMAYRMNGYTGQRISTFPVEEAWASYPTVADCICWSYQDGGHSFVIFQFPEANATWAYDIATQMWTQRGYWNTSTGQFDAQLQQCHAYCFGNHYVGDANSGNIYIQSAAYLTDDGNQIRRVRRAPYIADELEWIFHSQFELLCETGLPSNITGPSTAITFFILEDATTTTFWRVSIGDNGLLNGLQQVPPQPASTIILNDQAGPQSWMLGVESGGPRLTTIKVAYDSAFASVLPMATSGTALATGIFIQNGLLGTLSPAPVKLEPRVFLRWSDDGGHTWTSEYPAGVGLTGNYRKRVTWRRLGRSRGRVYEVSMSDAYPYRLIDAYINGDPDQKPKERMSDMLRKMA